MNDPRTVQGVRAIPARPAVSRDDACWRTAVLRAAGLSRREAGVIAMREAIDVHELVSLLEQDCPVHLALRIVGDGSERT